MHTATPSNPVQHGKHKNSKLQSQLEICVSAGGYAEGILLDTDLDRFGLSNKDTSCFYFSEKRT